MGSLSRMQGNSMHIVYLSKPKDYTSKKKTAPQKINISPCTPKTKVIFKIKYSQEIYRQEVANTFYEYFNNELQLYAQSNLKYNSKKEKKDIISLIKNSFKLDFSTKQKSITYALQKSLKFIKASDTLIFDFDNFISLLKKLQTNQVLIFQNVEKEYLLLARTLHNILLQIPLIKLVNRSLSFTPKQTDQIFNALKLYSKLFKPDLLVKNLYANIKIIEGNLIYLNIKNYAESFWENKIGY